MITPTIPRRCPSLRVIQNSRPEHQPRLSHKTIIVVEGPAGCGKTTLTRKLEQETNIPVVRSSLGKRLVTSEEAIISSAVNDYSKILQAINHPSPIVVVERFVVSQVIYEGLRLGVFSKDVQQIWFHSHELVKTAARELGWRSTAAFENDIHPTWNSFELNWLFLCPSLSELISNRDSCEKEYPWNAQLELMRYLDIAQTWKLRLGTQAMAVVDDLRSARSLHSRIERWGKSNTHSRPGLSSIV